MAALAPEVVGREVIAGIPCVVRRQALGAAGHIDRCIAEDPDHHLPDWLRYQALSETVPSQDGKSTFRWTRTDDVVMNATVDAGVFKLPRGITLKDFGRYKRGGVNLGVGTDTYPHNMLEELRHFSN